MSKTLRLELRISEEDRAKWQLAADAARRTLSNFICDAAHHLADSQLADPEADPIVNRPQSTPEPLAEEPTPEAITPTKKPRKAIKALCRFCSHKKAVGKPLPPNCEDCQALA